MSLHGTWLQLTMAHGDREEGYASMVSSGPNAPDASATMYHADPCASTVSIAFHSFISRSLTAQFCEYASRERRTQHIAPSETRPCGHPAECSWHQVIVNVCECKEMGRAEFSKFPWQSLLHRQSVLPNSASKSTLCWKSDSRLSLVETASSCVIATHESHCNDNASRCASLQ